MSSRLAQLHRLKLLRHRLGLLSRRLPVFLTMDRLEHRRHFFPSAARRRCHRAVGVRIAGHLALPASLMPGVRAMCYNAVCSWAATRGVAVPVGQAVPDNTYREYQAHDGSVDTGSTPYVEYDYDDGAVDGVAKYVRLDHVVYPDGRQIGYNYASGVDNIMSRLSSTSDSTGTLARYTYLGLGTIVTEDQARASVRLNYLDDSGDPSRLDRFGRIVDQVWEQYDGNGDVIGEIDHYHYTYDRAGNRTSKTNVLNGDLDETYTYNGLDELIGTERADDYDQSWTLDALGNWSAV